MTNDGIHTASITLSGAARYFAYAWAASGENKISHWAAQGVEQLRIAAGELGFDLVERLTSQEAADLMLAKRRAEDGEANGKCIPVADLMPYRPLAVGPDDRFADGNGTTFGFR